MIYVILLKAHFKKIVAIFSTHTHHRHLTQKIFNISIGHTYILRITKLRSKIHPKIREKKIVENDFYANFFFLLCTSLRLLNGIIRLI